MAPGTDQLEWKQALRLPTLSDINLLVGGLWRGSGVLQLGTEADPVVGVELRCVAATYQSVLKDFHILFTTVALFIHTVSICF